MDQSADRRCALCQALSRWAAVGQPAVRCRSCAVLPLIGHAGPAVRRGRLHRLYTSIHHATTIGKQMRLRQPAAAQLLVAPITTLHAPPASCPAVPPHRPRPDHADAATPSFGPASGWTTSWSWGIMARGNAGRACDHGGRGSPCVRYQPVQRPEFATFRAGEQPLARFWPKLCQHAVAL
jgi:hypothetical protein